MPPSIARTTCSTEYRSRAASVLHGERGGSHQRPPGRRPPLLHLLPAEDVVRTCVLARRWRGVWRSVPALRFTGVEGWGSADRFVQFVDHLLHLRCAGGGAGALLDYCDFDFDSDGFMRLPANERHASHWIWQALPLVRVLRVRVVEFGQEPSPLSELHLVSQHLARIELVGVRC